MAHILHLANEILLQIIGETIPDDFDGFSQSCSRLHYLTQKSLRQHRVYKKKYSTVCLHDFHIETNEDLKCELEECGHENCHHWVRPEWIHPLVLLRDLSVCPRITLYLKDVSIGKLTIQPRVTFKEAMRSIDEGPGDLIRRKVTQCPYLAFDGIRHWEEADHWVQAVKSGDLQAAVALLFSFFHGVQTLTFTKPILPDSYLEKMIDKITKTKYTRFSKKRGINAFSNLTEVCVSLAWEELRGGLPEFLLLVKFSALKSVRILRGDWIFTSLSSSIPKYPPIRSGVTDIEFHNSQIHPDIMSRLLERIPCLKRFTYQHCGMESNLKWSFFHLRVALLNRTKHTLEELNVTLSERGSSLKDDNALIGTLREFEVLKKIRINPAMFVINHDEDEQRPQRLMDFLPPSIEEFRVVGKIDLKPWQMRRMLHGLGYVPSLRQMIFEGCNSVDNATRVACDRAGVISKVENRSDIQPSELLWGRERQTT